MKSRINFTGAEAMARRNEAKIYKKNIVDICEKLIPQARKVKRMLNNYECLCLMCVYPLKLEELGDIVYEMGQKFRSKNHGPYYSPRGYNRHSAEWKEDRLELLNMIIEVSKELIKKHKGNENH
jgi:hypothetical protein